jgi:O-antigen ligase
MVQAHPWAGVGIGNFKPMMLEYREEGSTVDSMAHNTYLEMAAELGLPGLAVYLAILGSAYWTLRQVRRRPLRSTPPLARHAALALQAGLLGYAVASFFLSAEYQKLFWFMIFLSMCLPALRRPGAVLVEAVPADAAAPPPDYPAFPTEDWNATIG